MWTCTKCQKQQQDSTKYCMVCGGGKPSSQQSTTLFAEPKRSIPKETQLNTKRDIRRDGASNTMNGLGNIQVASSLVLSVVAFVVVVRITPIVDLVLGSDLPGVTYVMVGLVIAIVIFSFLVLPGLLLKSLARIWQNTQDISNLIRYQIDKEEERSQNK